MTVTEIIALCHAGYNSDQIMQLAQAQQMERAQQLAAQPVQQFSPAAPAVQPVQQISPAAMQALTQPAANAAPAQQPSQAGGYEQIMAELLGLKQAVQAGNMMQAQQPAQPMTADDIIANIIAPKPRKEG